MELEKLLKQRDAYAGKILSLMIKIAVIFLIPAAIGVAITQIWNINFIYLFPVAFILSWSGVIYLYRKISGEVRIIDVRIKELRSQDAHNKTLDNSKGSDAN
jgi:hypothetical protein